VEEALADALDAAFGKAVDVLPTPASISARRSIPKY
jgi:hypothetical protein